MCVCVWGGAWNERRSCGERRDSGGVEGNPGPSDHAVSDSALR